jgi:hypothetical protein
VPGWPLSVGHSHIMGAPAFEESPCRGPMPARWVSWHKNFFWSTFGTGIRKATGGVSLPSTPPARSGLFV